VTEGVEGFTIDDPRPEPLPDGPRIKSDEYEHVWNRVERTHAGWI
jgi:hypothetical protein